eukprot:1944956-Prymnesium_polylepis.1
MQKLEESWRKVAAPLFKTVRDQGIFREPRFISKRNSRNSGKAQTTTPRHVRTTGSTVPQTCCVPSVNRERTLAFNTLQKWRPCAAAGRAAVRRT